MKVRNIISHKSNGDEALLKLLESILGMLKYAYILDWIPEQGATLYTVVVPENRVVDVEIPHDKNEPAEWKISKLSELKKKNIRLPAEQRRKLNYILEAIS